MRQMAFDEIYQNHPEIYQDFHKVVGHTENYYSFLKDRGLLNSVDTVLDIGAGFGELAIRLLESHPRLQLGYLEPSKLFSNKFKSEIKMRNLENRIIELKEQSLEDYHSNQVYDLSLSIHSWYAIGKNEQMLQKALQSLNTNGSLFVSLVGPENFTLDLVRLLGVEVPNFNSADFSQWLSDLEIPHAYVLWNKEILLEKILLNGEFTPEGRGFLQFHTRSKWEDIPLDWVQKAKVYLESSSSKGKLLLQNGCAIINGRSVRM